MNGNAQAPASWPSSSRFVARATGACLILTMVLGIVAQILVGDRLAASGDPAATAAAIRAHEPLLHIGFAVFLLEGALQVVVIALYYVLLAPASRSLALSTTLLALVGCIAKTTSRLFFVAPLLVLGGPHAPAGVSAGLQEWLAWLFFELGSQGAALGLVFMGFGSIVKGHLLVRSGLLPRPIGWLTALAGCGWSLFLYPPLALRLFPLILLAGSVGVILQSVWLIVFGVADRGTPESSPSSDKLAYSS
jgi:hypothetical protein